MARGKVHKDYMNKWSGRWLKYKHRQEDLMEKEINEWRDKIPSHREKSLFLLNLLYLNE